MTHGDGMTQRAAEFVWPEVFTRLDAFLREPAHIDRTALVERALGIADLASFSGDASARTTGRELRHAGHPFEIIPFAWQGGDALVYALLLHDARVPPAFVSFAPNDDPFGPVRLADDAEGALGNLMAVALRNAEGEREAAELADAIETVCAALKIERTPLPEELDEGARSARFVEPSVPSGWTFEPCNDEVGVLAPNEAFSPEPPASEDLPVAEALLVRGYPASALAVARNVYLATSHEADRGADAARVMQRAYADLGREFLVRRVETYLGGQPR